jgi:outer membrane protein
MNKLVRTLLLLAACSLGTAFAQTPPAFKLLVVDMAKVLNGYYKTEDNNTKFNEAAQKAQEQLDEMNKQMQANADQYKEFVEKSRNSVLTQEVRTQAEQDAQKKMEELQRMQAEAQDFRAKTQRSLQQRMNTARELLFEEIGNVVKEVARARGATLVLDKSGPSLIGIPAIVYSDPAYDITDDVIKEVNKNRPPPAPSTPAPGAAPADKSSPAPFSVPNVTPPEKKP